MGKHSHLVRPIVYPRSGKHPGIGAEQRTMAEVAAMNDEQKFQPNVAEQRSGRTVRMKSDSPGSDAGNYRQWFAGEEMVVERATVVEGGVVLHLRSQSGALFVASESQVDYVTVG